jgi:tetratricopeptide (TPR) repeat protein
MKWFKRFLGNNKSNSDIESQTISEIKPLRDGGYEALLSELLKGLNHGWGRPQVLNYLGIRIHDQSFSFWLKRFGKELLTSPIPNYILGRQLVKLSENCCGEIGEIVGNLGKQLLAREMPSLEQLFQLEEKIVVIEIIVRGCERVEVIEGGTIKELHNMAVRAITIQCGKIVTKAELEADRNAIVSLGYFSSVSIEILPESIVLGVRLSFFVVPNPLFKRLYLQGSQIISQQIADNIFIPQYGNIFNFNHFEKGVEVLKELYKSNGFIFAKILENPKISDTGTLTLEVAEGIIESIQLHFINSTKLNTEEITSLFFQHEINLKVGSILNQSSLQEAIKHIYELGNFESVEPKFNIGQDPKKVAIVIDITEKSYVQPQEGLQKVCMSNQWHQMGVEYLGMHKYSDAVTSFDRALGLNPDDPETWYQYNIALQNLRRYPEAINAHNQAINLRRINEQRQKAQPLFEQSMAELEVKNYKEALDLFNQCLAIDPDNSETWHNRGLALAGLDNYQAALASFNIAIKKLDQQKTWIIRSVVQDNLGLYEDALASCEKALIFNHNDLDSLRLHGVILSHLKRYKAAIISFNKVQKIKPNDFISLYYSIVMEAYSGHYDMAVALGEKTPEILDQEDKNTLFWIRLLLLLSIGREQEAIALCEKIPENFLNPDIAKCINKQTLIIGCRLFLLLINPKKLPQINLTCQPFFSPKTGGIITFGYSFKADTSSQTLILKKKQLKAALLIFEEALADSTKNYNCYQILIFLGYFLILMALERYEQALSLCEEISGFTYDYEYTPLLLCICRIVVLLFLKQYEEAISLFMGEGLTHFEEISKFHFNDSNRNLILLCVQFLILSASKQYEEALAFCDRTAKVFSEDRNVTWVVSICRMIVNYEMNQPREDIYGFVEDIPKLETLRQTVKFTEDLRKNWATAPFEGLREASAFFSVSSVLLLIEENRVQDAINLLHKIIGNNYHNPDMVRCLQNFGTALLVATERYEEAVEVFQEYINNGLDEYNAWLMYGFSLLALERYNEAVASYDRALKIKPESQQAWANRGIGLYHLGRHQEAIDSLASALEATEYDQNRESGQELPNIQTPINYGDDSANKNNKIEIKDHRIWIYRGQAQFKLGNYEEAIACYDNALAINPEYYQGWISRGEAVLASRNYSSQLPSPLSPATRNPELNQRGYQGQLISLREGLKYCNSNKDIHAFYTGLLHHAIGKAHYFQGQQTEWQQNAECEQYWRDALIEYQAAMTTLTSELHLEQHLEVLQDMIAVYRTLGDLGHAKFLRSEGSELIACLLQNCSPRRRVQLAQKFASFDQLRVDELVDSEQKIAALELAEKRKNFCLRWLRDGWSDRIKYSPKYQEIQQLLNSRTAAIYFHLSPASMTTFIIRPKSNRLIALSASATKVNKWIKRLKEMYQDYCSGAKNLKSKKENNEEHPWQTAIIDCLFKIFDVSTILSYLSEIDHLILIPHRELHLLPIEYLFCDYSFTIIRLPSAQVGLDLQKSEVTTEAFPLVSIDCPSPLLFAEMESKVIAHFYQENLIYISSETATKQAVIETLQRYNGLFHFTGHGTHNIDSPLESTLELSNKEVITMQEIFKLNLSQYSLICLSACETGLTSQTNIIDEYVGLASGFLSAKASYVLSTLWQVQEISSALIMIEFHRELKIKKQPPTIALKKAQTWLRTVTSEKLAQWYEQLATEIGEGNDYYDTLISRANQAKKETATMGKEYTPYNHPYHWAGFIITGKINP